MYIYIRCYAFLENNTGIRIFISIYYTSYTINMFLVILCLSLMIFVFVVVYSKNLCIYS